MFNLLALKKDVKMDKEIEELKYQHERCRCCLSEIEKLIFKDRTINEIDITHLIENISGYISIITTPYFCRRSYFFP